MDFKSMLEQLSQLSEATQETGKGRVHKAEPGGYGRKFDTDEEGDEKKDDNKAKADAPKRGRGRPKKGADSDTGEVKTYSGAKELQSFMIGNVPKKSKELEKLPKKKHSLKEWIEEVETKVNEALAPGQKPIPVVGKVGDTQQTGAGFLNITDTSPTGQALQKAFSDLASQKKAQIVVPTTPQTAKPAQPTQPAAGSTGLAPAGTQPVKEKWAGDAKIHATGEYSSKTVEELKSMLAKLKKSGPHAENSPEAKKQRQINFALRAKGGWKKGEGAAKREDMDEGEIPHESGVDNIGAGLGAGRSQRTLEAKEDKKAMKKDHKAEEKGKKVTKDMEKVEEAAKPDFLDLDKDGNKKESMKKAADDKKKKKVNESMHKHSAARLMGKAHALAKEGYNCKYDDMDEARMYHEGYKEGLDECYGQQPIVGLVKENPAATVPGMASQAMPDMEEGNAFTAALAKTPKGEKFSVGGKTFTDRTDYDSKLDEFAFESWDQELNSLLTESEEVNEGMTVSISKGQQGSPDSVSVSAQDAEADALLGLIKQAGLGLFGDDSGAIGTGADDTMLQKQGGINVVGDHDGMMALIKKVAGGDAGASSDYEDEEGHEENGEEEHDHEHTDEETCNECGYMESDCKCDEEVLDEVESEDQMAYEVAEDNAPDSDEAETTADEDAEAAEDAALAKADELNEWANAVGKGPGKGTDASFEQDIEFMTKIIAGGLNKPKSTGQTTIPVIAGQTKRMDDPSIWAALAGIKK